LLVDGHDSDVVRKLLETDLYKTLDRHATGGKIFRIMGDMAPAMGMIGTLVGLVAMLSNMDDPKAIGPAIFNRGSVMLTRPMSTCCDEMHQMFCET
jgi:chemotaxis protein MotA